jgi:hypothetical protein
LAAVRQRIGGDVTARTENAAANMVHTHALETRPWKTLMRHLERLIEHRGLADPGGISDLRKSAARYIRLLPPQVAMDMIDRCSIAPVERLEQRVWTPSFATCKFIDRIKP